jgi:flagellar assembly factor FliW
MKFAATKDTKLNPVKPENIIHMPLGLLGFEHIRNYVMLANSEEAPFCWLQVMDDSTLAFLVISPFDVLPAYQPDVGVEDVRFLGIKEPQDAILFNIVTLRGGGRATVNLKAPILINRHTLIGKQAVPVNALHYNLQHPIPFVE